jgi:hypothetical protein
VLLTYARRAQSKRQNFGDFGQNQTKVPRVSSGVNGGAESSQGINQIETSAGLPADAHTAGADFVAVAIRVFLATVTLPAAAIGLAEANSAAAELMAEAVRMGFAGAALLAASFGKAHAFSAGAELIAETIGVLRASGGQ